MTTAPLKVGFLGAGYIAKWHADALARVNGAMLAGLCDLSRSNAEALATSTDAKVYASLDEMLAPGEIDCVHVLTPPQTHFETARKILEAGKHAFVEKPFVLSAADARELNVLSEAKGVRLGVNHNFLMLPGYERFRNAVNNGVIGQVDSFQANWRFPLPPMRSGPYGLWMLRAPQNILFEIGPHLFAFAADLFGDFDVKDVSLRYPIDIPGGITHYQGWRITGMAGETSVTLDLSLIEGHDDRSIEARGLGALARFNFAEDACTLETAPFGDIVIGPLVAQISRAGQATTTGVVNAARQIASLNMLAPYGLSITRACQSFYASLQRGEPVDKRLSPALAAGVVDMIERAAAIAAPQIKSPLRVVEEKLKTPPTTLVIGGTGFIGRSLVRALAETGHTIRVFSRGRPARFDGADGKVETFTGDLKSENDLLAAMDGIDGVYHLARAEEKTWQGYLDNDVAVTKLIGECCIKAGVKRLVYTGTIDSYDASRPDRPINEQTPFDPDIEERNLYARSKAACEQALKALADREGLPLVTVRPGIVIGRGGPLQHWGIAMWRGPTACKLWGRGDNIMPFVSVSDVADGLVRTMTAEGIEGCSFNLIGEPLLSARDYFDEVGRAHDVKMRARSTPLWTYYAVDVAKYWAKRLLARRTGLTRPSFRDWKSRAQLSPYENAVAKDALGWRPEAGRSAFIQTAIIDANLFGLTSGRGENDAAAKRAEGAARETDSVTSSA